MIEGVRVMELKKNPDERGYFVELLRENWGQFLEGDWPVQQSLSYSNPGVTRAWHRHSKGQNDYLVCIQGSVRLCVFDDRAGSVTRGELDEIVLDSSRSLQAARVVGSCWHGYRVLGATPAIVVYAVTRLYDYEKPDEERRPWDDPSVIPKAINGGKLDPRVGKPYDWKS